MIGAARWRLVRGVRVARDAALGWFEHDSTSRSAALAFYAMISLLPALAMAVVLAGSVLGRDTARAEVVQRVASLFGAQAAAAVQPVLEALGTWRHDAATPWPTVVLVFSSMAFLVQLQSSLYSVWESEPPARLWWTLIRRRLVSFVMVIVATALIVVLTVGTTLLRTVVARVPVRVDLPLSLIDLSSAFLIVLMMTCVYRFVPPGRAQWREAFGGAVVGYVLFAAGRFLVRIYLERSVMLSAYGAAGSVLLVFLWIYYSSMVLLYGAEVTRVLTVDGRAAEVALEDGG